MIGRCRSQVSITGSTVMEWPGKKVLKEQPRGVVPCMEREGGGSVCLRRTGKGFPESGQCGHPPLSPGRGNTAIWR